MKRLSIVLSGTNSLQQILWCDIISSHVEDLLEGVLLHPIPQLKIVLTIFIVEKTRSSMGVHEDRRTVGRLSAVTRTAPVLPCMYLLHIVILVFTY